MPASTLRTLAGLTALLTILLTGAAQAASPTWLGRQDIASHDDFLDRVSCGSPTYCVGAGTAIWVQDAAVQTGLASNMSNGISGASCVAGTKFCVLVDGGIDLASPDGGAYTVNGATLSARTKVSGDGMTSVSCPSTSLCWAADLNGKLWKYDGSTWTAGPSEPDDEGFMEVSCVSTTSCVAIDGDETAPGGDVIGLQSFTYNGTAWTADPGHFDLNRTADPNPVDIDLSCALAGGQVHCVATDQHGFVDTYTATPGQAGTWSATPQQISMFAGGGTIDDDQNFHVSCVGTFCMALSGLDFFFTSSDDGATWSAQSSSAMVPEYGDEFDGHGLTCASTTMCTAVTAQGYEDTWAPATLVPSGQPRIAGTGAIGQPLALANAPSGDPEAAIADDWIVNAGGEGQKTASHSTTSYTPVLGDVPGGDPSAARAFVDEYVGVGLQREGGSGFLSGGDNQLISNSITLSSGGGAGIGPAPTGGGTRPSGGGTTTVTAPQLAGSAKTSKSGTVSLPLTCPGSTTCTGTVSLLVAKRKAGSAHYALSAHKAATVKVKLSSSARKTLRRRHKLKVTLVISPAGGRASSRGLTLKLKR